MKNFYFLAIFFISVFGNAQVTKIFEFTDTKLLPRYLEKQRMKEWKGKVFYQGTGISIPSPYHYKTCNLVVSDGTQAGTKILKDLAGATEYDTNIVQWAATDNYLYFVHKLNLGGYQLWRTDGTPENTIKLDESINGASNVLTRSYICIGGATIDEFTDPQNSYMQYQDNFEDQSRTIGDKFYYAKFDPTDKVFYMYETDGTLANTKRVPGNYSYKYDMNMDYLAYNNKLYFRGAVSYLYYGNPKQRITYFEYDGTTTKEIPLYANRLGTVFNGKLYYENGNFEIRYTTNPGVSSTPVYSAPCTMGSSGPDNKFKKFQYRKTDNYMLIMGNNTCDNNIYTLDKNNVLKKVPLPADNQINEIIIGDNNVYILSTDFVLKTVNGISYWENQYTYNVTNINSDLSSIKTTKAYYGYFWGKVLNNILYFSDLPEKQNSLTPNGNNLELYRTNGSTNYMAVEVNKGEGQAYNWQTGQYFTAKKPTQPRNYFKLNNQIYFIGDNDYKTSLYSINPDFTFTNRNANNKWSDNENWAGQIVPFEADDVTISMNANPVIDGNAAANNMTVSAPINLTDGNLTIGSKLDLGAKITLNNNSLNLKGSEALITGGNSTNYIVTNGTGSVNVENLNSARGTVNLPIGTATNYNPVSIANTGTSDTFSARVSEGIANTTNGAVNATWDISEATAGGSNVNLTLGWNASQQNGSFDASTAKVGHYLNGSWTEENSGAVSNNSITATGISSFSPFAVMNFGALAASDFSKSKVLIYPNPFNENLNISTENGGVVYFYDLSGKLVSISILMKGTNSLNKSSLAKGVYIYQIRNTNGEILSSGKVIKK